MESFGDSRFECDRDATLAAYSRVIAESAARCACNGCRNFVLAGTTAFPNQFLRLLDSLGVDPLKDGEVYHNARLAPGKHHYGGWFHFVGALEVRGDFAPVAFGTDFSAYLCRKQAPCLAELEGQSLVELHFTASAVPWHLDEPEAT
jgi:hypothetical protein